MHQSGESTTRFVIRHSDIYHTIATDAVTLGAVST